MRDPGHEQLSSREAEVLWHQAHARTLARTAVTLGISVHTARTHLRRAYAKIGARNRREAYLWYADHEGCCVGRARYDSERRER